MWLAAVDEEACISVGRGSVGLVGLPPGRKRAVRRCAVRGARRTFLVRREYIPMCALSLAEKIA